MLLVIEPEKGVRKETLYKNIYKCLSNNLSFSYMTCVDVLNTLDTTSFETSRKMIIDCDIDENQFHRISYELSCDPSVKIKNITRSLSFYACTVGKEAFDNLKARMRNYSGVIGHSERPIGNLGNGKMELAYGIRLNSLTDYKVFMNCTKNVIEIDGVESLNIL